MVLDLLLGSMLYAQTLDMPYLRSSSQQYQRPQQVERLKTVDDVLKGTKFIPVCSGNFIQETARGNVIIFVYGKNNPNNIGTNYAMAEVMRRAIQHFPEETGVKFLKFYADCDPQLAANNYQKLTEGPYNVPSGPHVAFFKDGKSVLRTPWIVASPNERSISAWASAMKKNIEELLLGRNK